MKSIYQVKKIEKLAFQALALLHDKSKERSKGQHMTVSKWQNKLKISSLHFTKLRALCTLPNSEHIST